MCRIFRKKTFWLLILLLAGLVILLAHPGTALTPVQKVKNYLAPEVYQGPLVRIADISIPVELATTSEAIVKGLSGRTSLDHDKGLLFIFGAPARYRFWMPDMNFPIDILWLGEDKVVDITQEVSNNFDPLNPIFYRPAQPVRYVLEVNAGFAESHKLKIGDSVGYLNLQ